jgi:hypothetical protein
MILSDTVKYYDHYGFKNIKVASAIAVGTFVAWYVPSGFKGTWLMSSVHVGITSAQVCL